MKLNKLIRIGDAVELISEQTDSTIPDIIEGLTGICWDEEDAGRITDYHSEIDDD